MKQNKQSLKEILQAKEQRVIYQKRLINKYNKPLISFKLNIPGMVKDNTLYRRIFNEGLKALMKVFKERDINVSYKEDIYKKSGAESFIVIKESAIKLKKITSDIEITHPLGRIFDFDVLDEKKNQISRIDIGQKTRKCYICNENAFECSRSRKHSVKDLVNHIHIIAESYFEAQ